MGKSTQGEPAFSGNSPASVHHDGGAGFQASASIRGQVSWLVFKQPGVAVGDELCHLIKQEVGVASAQLC